MGLLVNIYRAGDIDCTNGGITSPANKAKGLCLVNVNGPFDPTQDYPAAMLQPHPTVNGIVRIVPARKAHDKYIEDKQYWSMAGGNFAYSSDSRFREAVENLTGFPFYGAVAVHDRVE